MIDEKLDQEFPEEVEIRENQDYDSEDEMTSETEETDDDESETNNAIANNYLDSGNMVTDLEMKDHSRLLPGEPCSSEGSTVATKALSSC